MGKKFWVALSYVGFLGLFVHLFGGGELARWGRNGFIAFIWELIAFLVLDVIRVKFGWSLYVFIPALAVTSVVKIVLMIKAVRSAGRAGDKEVIIHKSEVTYD
jgi:hypothetical protein